MRLSIVCLLSLVFLLTGCGGGSKPAPGSQYSLALSIIPSTSHGNGAPLPYAGDALATLTISGGSISDAGYPVDLQLVNAASDTLILNTHNCLKNHAHQKTCQFTIHNIYAGPDANKSLVDNIQVQAVAGGTTVQSNNVALTLQGHVSDCSDTLCLSDTTHADDYSISTTFDKPGLHHNSLEYQLQLSLGNPAKVFASATASLNNPALSSLAGKHLGLLNTSCSSTACVYTLQNENIASHYLRDNTESITASSHVSGEPSGQAVSQSSAVTLVLPPVQSCQIIDNYNQVTQGISTKAGALTVYNQGKPLTSSGYTADAMQQMYPVERVNSQTNKLYPIHFHVIALTMSDPQYLFGPNANEHITAKSTHQVGAGNNDYLDETSCSAANAAYNAFYGTSYKNPIATPYTSSKLGVTQQCKDGEPQKRLVYYAVPHGTPPSKNGWPVIILLHGSQGQTGGGYYLTPEDYMSGKTLEGSANANVFNNQWDWSNWETDPKSPAPSSSARYYSYSYYVRMRLIETWLSRGFAVIVPTTWNAGPYDWWNFEPSYSKPWPYTGGPSGNWPRPPEVDVHGDQKAQNLNSVITYFNEAYWPGMDGQFLQKLMAYINKPSDYDTDAGDLKFDTHNLFLSGYSAGANMVSRLINEFPTMTYTDKDFISHSFPKIKGAIILSGGSYACYLANVNLCPVGALEENYQTVDQMMGQGSVPKHPDTLVAESLYDDNAGGGPSKDNPSLLAGSVYYQSYLDICPKGSTCRPSDDVGTGVLDQAKYQSANPVQIIHTNHENIHHYYFPEMVIPSLNLMLNNTCVAKVSQ
jgi:hypothetical protein